MVLGNSDMTSKNQNIDVTINETNQFYESLNEKFDDLKITLTESHRLRREHNKQTSVSPLTTKQILSSLKNGILYL